MIKQNSNEMKVRGVADVVFCFDCTGSMTPCIENVKNNVASLVKGFNSTPGVKLDWRVRAMGYRDFEVDSEPLINDAEFTSDQEEFVEQLSCFRANGGGDYEESALDAIWYAVRTSDWRKKSHKVVVVFTDAGTKSVHSSTQKKLGVNGDIDFLRQTLASERIQLFIYGPDEEAYRQFDTVPKSNIDLGIDLSVPASFDKLMEAIGKTVSQSSVSDDTL